MSATPSISSPQYYPYMQQQQKPQQNILENQNPSCQLFSSSSSHVTGLYLSSSFSSSSSCRPPLYSRNNSTASNNSRNSVSNGYCNNNSSCTSNISNNSNSNNNNNNCCRVQTGPTSPQPSKSMIGSPYYSNDPTRQASTHLLPQTPTNVFDEACNGIPSVTPFTTLTMNNGNWNSSNHQSKLYSLHSPTTTLMIPSWCSVYSDDDNDEVSSVASVASGYCPSDNHINGKHNVVPSTPAATTASYRKSYNSNPPSTDVPRYHERLTTSDSPLNEISKLKISNNDQLKQSLPRHQAKLSPRLEQPSLHNSQTMLSPPSLLPHTMYLQPRPVQHSKYQGDTVKPKAPYFLQPKLNARSSYDIENDENDNVTDWDNEYSTGNTGIIDMAVWVNEQRRLYGNGLRKLERSPELDYLAAEHSEAMANAAVVFHSVSTVTELQIKLTCTSHVGENVQRGHSVLDLQEQAMSSSPLSTNNRRNILSTQFTEFGSAIAISQTDGRIYCCQLFRRVD